MFSILDHASDRTQFRSWMLLHKKKKKPKKNHDIYLQKVHYELNNVWMKNINYYAFKHYLLLLKFYFIFLLQIS